MPYESFSPGRSCPSWGRGMATPPPDGATSPADPPEPGRLHEIRAATAEDAPSAAAAALLMAWGARPENVPHHGRGTIAWLRPERAERRNGRLHGPGLAALGLDPARLLLAVLPDDLALLKAAADLLRSGSISALLLELHGPAHQLDLTASRRLALAAAGTNTPAILLRVGGEPVPSAAWRRWSVGSRASQPLEAGAPGHPAFTLDLQRNRTGPAGGRWQMEWRPDGWRTLEPDHAPQPPLSRPALPVPAVKQVQPLRRSA